MFTIGTQSSDKFETTDVLRCLWLPFIVDVRAAKRGSVTLPSIVVPDSARVPAHAQDVRMRVVDSATCSAPPLVSVKQGEHGVNPTWLCRAGLKTCFRRLSVDQLFSSKFIAYGLIRYNACLARRVSPQVVTATGTELLRAWRTFSDFSALAQSARALGAAVAAEFWNRLDQVLGSHQGRRTDPSSLKTQSRLLGRFLTIMLEELAHSDVDVSSTGGRCMRAQNKQNPCATTTLML